MMPSIMSQPNKEESTARGAMTPAEPALTCRCQAHNYPSGHTGHDAKLHGPAHEEESTARGEKSTAKPASHSSLTHEHVSAVEASMRRRGNTSLSKENDEPQLWDLDCLYTDSNEESAQPTNRDIDHQEKYCNSKIPMVTKTMARRPRHPGAQRPDGRSAKKKAQNAPKTPSLAAKPPYTPTATE